MSRLHSDIPMGARSRCFGQTVGIPRQYMSQEGTGLTFAVAFIAESEHREDFWKDHIPIITDDPVANLDESRGGVV